MKLILILLMNALFAATFPLGKLALNYCTPIFLTGVRMVMAGLIFYAYSRYTNPEQAHVKRKDYWLIVKTTLFYVLLAFLPEFWALQYLSSIKTNLLWSVQPFFAAVLGFILFSEKLTTRKIIALIIGFSGMLPIIFTCNPGELSLGDICSVSYPELALFVAVFSTTYAWFLIKQLLAKNYNLSFINGVTMTLGGIACLLVSFCQSYFYGQAVYTDLPATFAYSVILVAASNIIGYSLYGYFLSHYSITFLAFSGFTCPLFGFLFSYLLGEPIYMSYIYGCLLILFGLYLFYKEE